MTDEAPKVDVVSKKPRGRPPGPPKPPKEKKQRGRPKGEPKAAPNHAPFQKLVEQALDDIYQKGGVSKRAIVSHIMAHEPECQDKLKVQKRVKTVLRRMVTLEVLIAPKAAVGKFRRSDDTGDRGRPKGSVKKDSDKKKSPKKAKKAPKASPAKPKKLKVKLAAGKSADGTPKKRGRPKKTEGKAASPAKAAKATTPGKGKRGRPKKVQ